jgi:hypothetical protein
VVFRIVGREKEMPIRLRSTIPRIIGYTIALLIVVIPLQAFADEPLIDASVEPASTTVGVVEDVVEPVAADVDDAVEPVADDVAEPTAEVVVDVGATAGAAVEELDDATAAVVNEAPTVEETEAAVGNASGQVQENAHAAVNDVSQNGGSATGAIAGDQSDGATATQAAPAGGGKEPRPQRDRPDAERITITSAGPAWRRMHFARLGMTVPTASYLYQPVTLRSGQADEPGDDPCEQDPGLACLGLLFGIGEFAESGGGVLGLFLAATGVALRGLIFLAFALLLAGVITLSIAPKRATPGAMG